MAPKLTADEKSAELTKILGVKVNPNGTVGRDDESEENPTFSSAMRVPAKESYVPDEDPEDDDDDDDDVSAQGVAGKGKEPGEKDVDDMPTWAQVLLKKNDELSQGLKASQSELQQLRNYQQPASTQAPAVPAKEAEPEEPYWVDSRHLQEIETKYESRFKQLDDIAVRQERSSFDTTIDQLKAARPDFFDVVPKEVADKIWETYRSNPTGYGGFGRNWKQEFDSLYKHFNHDRLEAKLKEQAAKNDELAKKRDERKDQQNANLGKVSRGGAAVQEPKAVREKGVRDYKHPALRKAALKLFSGE